MPYQLTAPEPPPNLCGTKNNQALGGGDGRSNVRDPVLNRAIDAAGGVVQLARKIGIAQPSISNWNRVPAERVIAVEAATRVFPQPLPPHLYNEPAVKADAVHPV